MRVTVNGKSREVEAQRLSELLIECGFRDEKIAVAVNETFVHREQRPTTLLEQGCRIEVLAPMEGG